jgi:hypothetical protein
VARRPALTREDVDEIAGRAAEEILSRRPALSRQEVEEIAGRAGKADIADILDALTRR